MMPLTFHRRLLPAGLLVLAVNADAGPLSWGEVQAMAAPAPQPIIAYGPAPQQFGELRLPDGPGPHPVVVLIHGGCWLAEFGYDYFRHFGRAFADAGLATWTIEYRRLGDPGGGWPGTFTDVGQAIDHLRTLASETALDLNRVLLAGHSAGGQLALWAATRERLPADSPLASERPLPVHGVLGLAAITDLAAYRIGPPGSCHAAVEPLLGGPPDAVPARYAQTSPAQRLPLGLPAVLIQGAQDSIVAPESARTFVDQARAAGDDVEWIELEGAGHFDTGVPTPAHWPGILAAVRRLLAEENAE